MKVNRNKNLIRQLKSLTRRVKKLERRSSAGGSITTINSSSEYELPLGESYFSGSPSTMPVASGLFTPMSNKVKVTVEIGAAVTGIAKGICALYIGPPNSLTTNYSLPQLSPDKDFGAGGGLANGVRQFTLGAISPHSIGWPEIDYVLPTPTSNLTRTFEIDNLTPFAQTKWELGIGVVGAAGGVELEDVPNKIAVSKIPVGLETLRAITTSNSKVQIYSVGNTPAHPNDSLLYELFVAPGNNTDVAISDDGSIGAATNQDADAFAALSIIDIHEGTAEFFAAPDGCSGAAGVTISSDNSTVWVAFSVSDNVAAFDLETEEWGEPISTIDGPIDLRLSENEDKLVVCSFSNPQITVIDTDDFSKESFNYGGLAGGFTGVAIRPGGHEQAWFTGYGIGAHYIACFDLENMEFNTTLTRFHNAIAGDPAFIPDGKTLFIFASTTPHVRQYSVHDDRPPTLFLGWPANSGGGSVGGGDCGPNGQIFVTSKNGTFNGMVEWWGSRIRIRPEQLGEFFKIRFEGAT